MIKQWTDGRPTRQPAELVGGYFLVIFINIKTRPCHYARNLLNSCFFVILKLKRDTIFYDPKVYIKNRVYLPVCIRYCKPLW